MSNPANSKQKGIAIVGMAGRFPKARNVDEFWKNLCEGAEGISFFSDEELAAAGVAVPKDNPHYVKARGVLEDAEMFDAAFFNLHPKDAEILDPQHRVFLECAWEALERAGYDSEKFPGAIGVFAGMSMNTYFAHIVRSKPELVDLVGEYQTMLANDKDFLPTRVSYKLNLKGPSLNIQTACSTSLVAVCEACQHLLNCQCDMALAGAVSIAFPRNKGYLHQEGGIASPDGHCRAFDAKSAGTVAGEGVGIVVLKRMEDAVVDGDTIYAVIKGFATNNDGSQKVGYTAPSVDGQAEVIALAQGMAGVEPDSISYVEAHGTGTKLGDPIEIEALTKAFRSGTSAQEFCAIGSVKSNIGHLDAAAGVAGLIKTALALHHKKIPASLHFESPNPNINFADSPFFVNAALRDWKNDNGPRRAGVSSFGIGGTNAHVILEEALDTKRSSESRSQQLLLLSAKTPAALDAATHRLADYLRENGDANLADVAYTLQLGRREFAHRRAIVCRDLNDAVTQLAASDSKPLPSSVAKEESASIVFMFPGQGTQQVNMAREIYQTEAVFREQVDLCCDLLEPHLGFDLRTVLFPPADKNEAAAANLLQTSVTQPALFVVEYALAKLWMHWGVIPSAMIGHSIGEYVAACLAEVFSLEDALKLVVARGRLMQEQPSGAMLAVRLPEAEVSAFLNDQLSLAAINSKTGCVVSGNHEAIDALKNILAERGVACALLRTSHAFHSLMMQPVVGPFAELVAGIERNAPRIPFISNVTGTWITDAEAIEPSYWTDHLRGAVRFADGLGELLNEPNRILLEVGPGQVLSGLANQHPARESAALVLSALPRSGSETADVQGILSTLGKLWMNGVTMDWNNFWKDEQRCRVCLPTYPFERKRYYVEPRLAAPSVAATNGASAHNGNGHGSLPHPVVVKSVTEVKPRETIAIIPTPAERAPVMARLVELFRELSGVDLSGKTNASFTELGFDSLFLTQASLAIEKNLNVQVAFRQLLENFSTLDTLANHIASRVATSTIQPVVQQNETPVIVATACSGRTAIPETQPARSATDGIPLTDAQRELWLASQMSDAASCAYNECRLLHLRGNLQPDCLRRALEKVVQRHEALRVTIDPSGEFQTVHPAMMLEVPEVDLTVFAESARTARLDALQADEAVRPFNLSTGPLLRAQLVRLSEQHHVLAVSIHHIVCDGYSFGIVLHDLAKLYAAECHGTEPELATPLQLSDYAREQTVRREGQAHAAAEAYWLSEFADEIPVLDLPTDHPRPAVWRFEGARETRVLPARLTRQLKQLSADHGCTMFTALLAVYGLLLRKLSGQKDVIIGVPIADRMMERGETLVGHCVNFLPVRACVADERPAFEHLTEVQKRFLDAFEHQQFTFGNLIQKLNIPRNRDRTPLISVTFNVERLADELKFDGLQAELAANPHGFSNFDLSLNVTEMNGTLRLDCRYNKSLFTAKTLRRWLEHFQTALESIVADAHRTVGKVSILTEPERQQVLEIWNQTQTDYPRYACIQGMFETQVEKTPNAVAVEFEGVRLTYRELNTQANQLAHYLMRLGVSTDVPVALCLERSVHMIVGILGILKAGGAYVSLDLAHPLERLALLLDDIQPPVLLTQEKMLTKLPDLTHRGIRDGIPCDTLVVSMDGGWETMAWRIDTNPITETRADNLAYVSFTSGSTGKPKGVCVTHRGVVRLVKNTDYATFAADDVFLQLSPLAFDASTLEIWGALLNGGRLVLFPSHTPSLAELGRFIRSRQITTLWLTAGLFHQMVEEQVEDLRGVRQLLAGGDTLSPSHVKRALEKLPNCRIVNGYGPTENTTFTCCHTISRNFDGRHSVPIGRPIANTQVYILDENLQPVPIGVGGELHVGGDGLARGYLNHPELTAEKFIANPFAGEGAPLLYKTGDLARWTLEGTVEFLGRIDLQTKIRGFRVEPGEVETVLKQHQSVRDCAVLVMGAGEEKHLAAFVVPQPGDGLADAAELRRFLESKLPAFMVPTRMSFMDALPLASTGKVNRRALPLLEATDVDVAPEAVLPRTPVEERLAKIWCDLLGRESVGIHENFFQLGGHSLLVTRAVSRIHDELKKEISMGLFFDSPTIAQLASAMTEQTTTHKTRPVDSLVAIQPHGSKPPLFLVHGAGGGMLWGYTTLARCLGLDQPVYAFKSRGLEGLEEFNDLQEMAAHYVDDLRAFQPHGPYYLGGYCFGGNVAYEMARQLEAAGEKVGLLVLLNSVPANSNYAHVRPTPKWLMAFVQNVRYLVGCHFSRAPGEQRDFLAWQISTLGRRILRFFLPARRAQVGAGEIVDLSAYPASEKEVWEAHVQALLGHQTKPYAGKVSLLRSPGHQFWCSFDPAYGWDEFVQGGVDVHFVPGAHEEILEDPHINVLTGKLKNRLDEEQGQQVKKVTSAPTLGLASLLRPVAHLPLDEAAAQQVPVDWSEPDIDFPQVQSAVRGVECEATEILVDDERSAPELQSPNDDPMHRVLVEWNDTGLEYPKTATLMSLFEAQVERTPEATALVAGETRLTYRELNERVNQIAHHLRQLGVGPEVLVGICMQRSWRMLAGILGILKAGGAYVPMDPAYPKDRLFFMLSDAKVKVLLTQESLLSLFAETDALKSTATVLCLDSEWEKIAALPKQNAELAVKPENLAYVIYTSGSTGQPKGVAIEHQAPVGLMYWAREVFLPEEFAGTLAATSVCFDLSIFEMFVPLSWGGKVILADNAIGLTNIPAANEVTLVNTVPSAMRELLRVKGIPSSVQVVNLAGEPLATALVDQIYSETSVDKVYDLYGPTETTTYSTGGLRKAGEQATIGRPLANEQVYLLDSNLKPVPLGEAGELLIGGIGLARGYLHRSQMTAEKFIPNPFKADTRLYKTGDLARWREDGNLIYLGRIDHQVKIRGFRIELGEIEAALRRHPDVGEAAVIARDHSSGDKRLVAYLVAREGKKISAQSLREVLRVKLPDYMVPSAFVFLDALPLTPNGKLDRKALPEPEYDSEREIVAPRTETEKMLVGIWREVLGVERIGVQDDFFELGGHSLLAIQVVSRVRSDLQMELPLFVLFDVPTIAALAEGLDSGRWPKIIGETTPLKVVPRDQSLPVSFVQERLWFIHQLEPDSHAYNVPLAVRLNGKLDLTALSRAFDQIVRCHEALRTSFVVNDGNISQVIAPPSTLKINCIDLRSVTETNREVKVQEAIKSEAQRPFDLAKSPLVRVTLIQLSDTEHVLVLVMHHTISDGWSLAIIFQELEALYNEFANGVKAKLPELPVQPVDIAQWQRQCMSGVALDLELAHWKQVLAGAPHSIALPADKTSSAKPGNQAARSTIQFSKKFSEELNALCQRKRGTPFMFCLAALATTLSKWTGQHDLVIGTVTAGRNRRELENAIGCFMNFLPLRCKIEAGQTAATLFDETRKTVLDAQAHQDCPFQQIVEALKPERKMDGNPLYNVGLLLQNFPKQVFKADGIQASLLPVEMESALLDLRFEAEEDEQGLSIACEYKTSLFSEPTIGLLLESIRNVLEKFVAQPDVSLADIQIVEGLKTESKESSKEAEPEQIAVTATFTAEFLAEPLRYWMKELDFNAATEFAPYQQVFQQLLDPTSLLGKNRRGINLVLIRLEDWEPNVEQGMRELVSALKAATVRTSTPHFVCFCPSSRAIAKDPSRKEHFRKKEETLAKDLSGIVGVSVLTSDKLLELYPVAEHYDPRADELGHVPYTPAFFTALGTMIARKFHALRRPPLKVIVLDCDNTLWSGVCGEDGPEGVRLDSPRRALQEFMRRQMDSGRVLCLCSKNSESDVVATFKHHSEMPLKWSDFVATRINWNPKSENLKALARELNLGLDSFVLVDDNPMECAEVVANCPEATALQLPENPEAIPQFLKHCWIFDGEKATEEDAQRTKFYQANRERDGLRKSSSNLSEFLKALELDVQITKVSSDQIVRVAQLTQRTNQFNTTTRRRTEAEVEKLCRESEAEALSVSVRDRFGDYGLTGVMVFRIAGREMGVDSFMLSCRVLGKGVEHQMLAKLGEIARERGLSHVDIQFTPSPKNKPALDFFESLGASFQNRLNDGCVFRFPTDFAVAVKFDPQGTTDADGALATDATPASIPSRVKKFDRWGWIAQEANDAEKLLGRIESHVVKRTTSASAAKPRTKAEEQLCTIWQSLLHLEKVGINDDFFELGGHSLLAVRLFAEIGKTMGVQLPLVTIFKAPTIAQLAAQMPQDEDTPRAQTVFVPIQPLGSRPPLFLVHGAGGDVLWGYANLAHQLGNDQPVYGIQARPDDDPAKYKTLEEMAADYIAELKAFYPHGPYCLGGYCFGGNLAYEMARQLRAEGRDVAFLVLLESTPANGSYEKVQWFNPAFPFRFARNSYWWLRDFFGLSSEEQRSLVRRKIVVLGRKLSRKLRGGKAGDPIDLDDVIDATKFREEELRLWDIHLRLLQEHTSRPYSGHVTVFRTSAHPLFSSYEHDLGWSALAEDGVTVQIVPGSHGNVFLEPNVRTLAQQVESSLKARVPESFQDQREIQQVA